MRGCGTLAAARAPFLALLVGSLMTPGLAFSSTKHTAPSAKVPFAYETSGVVDVGANPASVTGPALLKFDGLSNATFDPKATQPINLGQFVIIPSSVVTGQSTTYSATPFEVEIQTPEFNKVNKVPLLDKIFPTFGKRFALKTVIENSLLLRGHLDGTVSANGQTSLTATVDSIKLGSIESPSKNQVTHYAFPIRFSQLKLPDSWVMSAITSPTTTTTVAPAPAAEMLIASTPTPTPEPSTVAFFAVALGGLVLGRRRLRPR